MHVRAERIDDCPEKAVLTAPLLWIAVLTATLAIPFRSVPWSFVDLYEVLYAADSHSWRSTLRGAFSAGVEYRPAFTIAVKFFYQLAGLHLWFYKLLILTEFAAILGLFVCILRPTTNDRAKAAILAVTCVAGLHSSRILFTFVPINQHAASILLVLLTIGLALNARPVFLSWLIVPLTLMATLLSEFGLVIPPVVTALWWARARGTNRRSLLGCWAAFGIYAAIRFGLGNQSELGLTHGDTGLGFAIVDPKYIENVFEHAPLLFWIYNVIANVLTVLASEPRQGVYEFVYSLLRGTASPWQWMHIVSSVCTTLFIWIRIRRRDFSLRDRQLVWLGLALLVFGGGLGAAYTRDRIALAVGLGYGVLLYVCAADVLEHPPGQRATRASLSALLIAVFTVWALRDAELWFQIADTAWERHLEWTDRFEDLGGYKKPQTALLEELKRQALSFTDGPRHDSGWKYDWLERRERPVDR